MQIPTKENVAHVTTQHTSRNANHEHKLGPKRPNVNALASLCSIQQALNFIDDSDRETWIKYGMAIQAEVGDAGFDADLLRAMKPDAVIVLCTDDEEAGRRNAAGAAQVGGGFDAIPEFSEGASHE